jgi:hypothetical protein
MHCTSYLPTYEDGTEDSEMLALKLQAPVNHPEEDIQHLKHSEHLKSRISKEFANFIFKGIEA